MLLEILRLLVVTGLLVVLPGFLLVNAVFPAGRLTRLERSYMAVAGGVLLLILVGVVLGFLPHGTRGFFQTSATGSNQPRATMGKGSASRVMESTRFRWTPNLALPSAR